MDRRMFLRTALRELELVLTDQPGLLGPKVKKCLHFLKFRIGIVTIFFYFKGFVCVHGSKFCS